MTDDRVRTFVHTDAGRLPFQTYLVRGRGRGRVRRIELAGASRARPAPGVIRALAGSRAILIAPSNPLVSVGPMLAIPAIRRALAAPARAGGSHLSAGRRAARCAARCTACCGDSGSRCHRPASPGSTAVSSTASSSTAPTHAGLRPCAISACACSSPTPLMHTPAAAARLAGAALRALGVEAA